MTSRGADDDSYSSLTNYDEDTADSSNLAEYDENQDLPQAEAVKDSKADKRPNHYTGRDSSPGYPDASNVNEKRSKSRPRSRSASVDLHHDKSPQYNKAKAPTAVALVNSNTKSKPPSTKQATVLEVEANAKPSTLTASKSKSGGSNGTVGSSHSASSISDVEPKPKAKASTTREGGAAAPAKSKAVVSEKKMARRDDMGRAVTETTSGKAGKSSATNGSDTRRSNTSSKDSSTKTRDSGRRNQSPTPPKPTHHHHPPSQKLQAATGGSRSRSSSSNDISPPRSPPASSPTIRDESGKQRRRRSSAHSDEDDYDNRRRHKSDRKEHKGAHTEQDRYRERSLSRDGYESRPSPVTLTRGRISTKHKVEPATTQDSSGGEDKKEKTTSSSSPTTFSYSRPTVTSRLQQLCEHHYSIRMYFSLSYLIDSLCDIKPLRSAHHTPRSCPYLSSDYRIQFSDPDNMDITLPEITEHIDRGVHILKEVYESKACCMLVEHALISVDFWNRLVTFWNDLQIVYQRLRVDASRSDSNANASASAGAGAGSGSGHGSSGDRNRDNTPDNNSNRLAKKVWHASVLSRLPRLDLRMNDQSHQLRYVLSKAVAKTLTVEEAIQAWNAWYRVFNSHDFSVAWTLLHDIITAERGNLLRQFEEAHLSTRDPRNNGSSKSSSMQSTPLPGMYVSTLLSGVAYYSPMNHVRNWFHDQFVAQKESPTLDAIYESCRHLIGSVIALAYTVVMALSHVCDSSCTVRGASITEPTVSQASSSLLLTTAKRSLASGGNIHRVWQTDDESDDATRIDDNKEKDKASKQTKRSNGKKLQVVLKKNGNNTNKRRMNDRGGVVSVPNMSITTTVDPFAYTNAVDDDSDDGDEHTSSSTLSAPMPPRKKHRVHHNTNDDGDDNGNDDDRITGTHKYAPDLESAASLSSSIFSTRREKWNKIGDRHNYSSRKAVPWQPKKEYYYGRQVDKDDGSDEGNLFTGLRHHRHRRHSTSSVGADGQPIRLPDTSSGGTRSKSATDVNE